MSIVFTPIRIGRLDLRNRFVRSATAERRADPDTGAPLPALADLYAELARGGVGLIITGHTYVHPHGKVNPWMASMATDELMEAWRRTIRPAQEAGARVMMQINFAGSAASAETVPRPWSPSGIATDTETSPLAMNPDQIHEVITAFGAAARRVRDAGFDGVQLHAAHGYGACQFLTPRTNQRDDAWGGDAPRRRAFLLDMIRAARAHTDADFPLWMKLGVAGDEASGLRPAEGAAAAAACARAGVDCIEISHGMGIPVEADPDSEATYRPLAETVRQAVGPDYPLALVCGFRSVAGMEAVLRESLVQLVSLCRPFIAEPDLVRRLENDPAGEAACTRCDLCRPTPPENTVACRNVAVVGRNRNTP